MRTREWTSHLQRCCDSTNLNARPGGSPNPTCGAAAPLPSPGHTRRLRGRPPGRDPAPLTPAPALSAARTPAPPPATPPAAHPLLLGLGQRPGRSTRAPQTLQARPSHRGPLSAPTAPYLLQHGGPAPAPLPGATSAPQPRAGDRNRRGGVTTGLEEPE